MAFKGFGFNGSNNNSTGFKKLKEELKKSARVVGTETKKSVKPVAQTNLPGQTQVRDAVHGEQALKEGRAAWLKNQFDLTFQKYYEAAQCENAEAMNLLANLYRDGRGVQRDYREALFWYEKSAALGDPFAGYGAGKMYERGLGVERDIDKARKYFAMSAEKGHTTAALYIDMIEWITPNYSNISTALPNLTSEQLFKLSQNLIDDQRLQLAVYFTELSARRGDADALNNMGLFYREGRGVPMNNKLAKIYFEEAAELGNKFAFYNLGQMYEYGLGLDKDLRRALNYFVKAREAGHNDAQLLEDNINSILRGEQDFSFNPQMSENEFSQKANYYQDSKKLELRARLFLDCKDTYFSQAVWWHIMGLMYMNGEGVPQDLPKAIEYLEKAAGMNQDHSKYSHHVLGNIFEYGRGVEVDYDRALAEYQEASRMGYDHTDYIQNILYIKRGYIDSTIENLTESGRAKLNPDPVVYTGDFGGTDFQYLEGYYEQVVSVEDADGIGGYMFCSPNTVRANEHLFSNWNEQLHKLERGEECNFSKSVLENNMAVCYLMGLGIEQNPNIALEMFEELMKDGNCLAALNLGLIYENEKGVDADYELAMNYYAHSGMVETIREASTARQKELSNKILSSREETSAILKGKGYLYLRGWGVKKDRKKALEYYSKAISCGGEDEGVFQMIEDIKETIYFIEKELEQYKDASTSVLRDIMSSKLEEGKAQMAYEIARILADRNDSFALEYLGECAFYGLAEPQNIEKAIELLEKAKEYGSEETSDLLYNLKGDQAEVTSEGEVDDEEEIPAEEIEADIEDGGESMISVASLPENLDEYFEGMIGIDSVKCQLNKIYDGVKMKLKRNEILIARGEEPIKDEQGYNFIITGNPGTGKTQVARIIAQILFDIGIRENESLEEVDRSKLVGSHLGETEKRTTAAINRAMGGTLFVDEAYTLYKDDSDVDFGSDAIDTLLKAIEDKRDRFSVIIAGYREPMMEMIKKSNGGFGSRFAYTIDLPDFRDEELIEIAHTLIEKKKYVMEGNIDSAIKKCINHDRIDHTFGNARYIRELVDRAQNNQAARLQRDGYVEDDELFILKPEDFWMEDFDGDSVQKCLNELSGMVGLSSVKREVQLLIGQMQVQLEKEKRGIDAEDDNATLHMAFKGNPGTGKTTVARLIGRLYSALGILKRKDVFIEVNRASLVGKYMGETAQNVKKAVSSANGGILFIDEAYSLIQGENDSFGHEAVDTLVAEMENNRKNMVVIFAGYSRELEEFFANNAGLKSRVPVELYFDDYSLDELMIIAFSSLKKKGMNIKDADVAVALKEKVGGLYQEVDFGNARGVRNIIERLIRVQNMRIASMLNSEQSISDEAITEITLGDIVVL